MKSVNLCVMTDLETKKPRLPVSSFTEQQMLSHMKQINNAITKNFGSTKLFALEQKPLSNNVNTMQWETIIVRHMNALNCFVEVEALNHNLKS